MKTTLSDKDVFIGLLGDRRHLRYREHQREFVVAFVFRGSFGNNAEKDTAGCRAFYRKSIVIGMSVIPTLGQSPEKEKAALADRVKIELRRLHIPGTVRGFNYLLYILLEVIPAPGQLTLITKRLYPHTARAFGVTSSSVERAIRTAVSICWRCGGCEVLDQMALHHLSNRPTATQFIDIVSDYIRRTESQ